jgi:hypothetical protein
MARGWSVLAVAVLVLALIGAAQTSAGQSLLRAARLSGAPRPYADLYFASPSQLPAQLYSQEALLSAPFVIRNESTAGRSYSWLVTENRNGQQRQLLRGRSAVAAGGSTTVDWRALTSCGSGRIQISVRLVGQRTSIDFWTTCLTASGAAS